MSTLEDKVECLEDGARDAVEKLETKGDELKDDVNIAINKVMEDVDQKGDAFQVAVAALREELQGKIEKLKNILTNWIPKTKAILIENPGWHPKFRTAAEKVYYHKTDAGDINDFYKRRSKFRGLFYFLRHLSTHAEDYYKIDPKTQMKYKNQSKLRTFYTLHILDCYLLWVHTYMTTVHTKKLSALSSEHTASLR
ncbi:hypothetical protein V6N12_015528 [Hibiscus sabdariffa]|uniref:Uncharacterized protein n=1 Tax=Hibiscus sabdariffa TaxID=183260 RepID=A0ABR2DNF0_9ROSI